MHTWIRGPASLHSHAGAWERGRVSVLFQMCYASSTGAATCPIGAFAPPPWKSTQPPWISALPAWISAQSSLIPRHYRGPPRSHRAPPRNHRGFRPASVELRVVACGAPHCLRRCPHCLRGDPRRRLWSFAPPRRCPHRRRGIPRRRFRNPCCAFGHRHRAFGNPVAGYGGPSGCFGGESFPAYLIWIGIPSPCVPARIAPSFFNFALVSGGSNFGDSPHWCTSRRTPCRHQPVAQVYCVLRNYMSILCRALRFVKRSN